MQGGAHLVAQGIHPEHHRPAGAGLHPLAPGARLWEGTRDQPASLLQGSGEALGLLLQ